MQGRGYKDLEVWKQAMDLVVQVYDVTKNFPGEERFGLTSQMRRCSVSVPSNIAEGQGRHSAGEFRQFLSHARGSLAELETQVLITERLQFAHADVCRTLLERIEDVMRLLNGLLRAINEGRYRGRGD